ncbi:Helicase associated domain protein [Kitasatospora sp. NPDC056783]|uniref:DEAD/DEAH box helicase n=1 Tax=Kitasatospora sp. NPDC056783 TaxID=3345943 RepID=UPI00369E90DE
MAPQLPEGALRADQIEAATAIVRVLEKEDRTILTKACGTGKTRTSGEISRRIPHRTELRTFPSLALIAQTAAELVATFGRASLGRVVAVCSDKKVLARHRGVLDDLGASVTSDPAALAAIVAEPAARVTVFCTLQSLDVLITAHAQHRLPAWNLAIIDEAHRTVGLEDRGWTAVHDQHRIPADKRVSMTATMKIVTSRVAEGHDDIVSMHNRKVFGPIGYRLSYATARELKIVAPYRLVVPVITDERVREAATAVDNPVYYQAGAAGISAEVLATQIALLRAATEAGSRRMITYHRTIADARWFATTLPLALQHLDPSERPASLWAAHISGRQDAEQRERILDRLRSAEPGLVVVSNAALLTEGVNIPDIDSIALLSPRGDIDCRQAIGRAGRLPDPSVDKTALVFAPAFLREGEDPAAALRGPEFATAYGVVRALAAYDDELASTLEKTRRSLGASSYTGRGHSAPEIPDWLAVSGIEVPPEFAAAIAVQVVRSATSPWEEFLGAVAAFRAEHGHLRIPRGWATPDGLQAGNWLEYQRTRYSQGLLAAEQIEQLEALDVVWNTYDRVWETFISDLKEFRKEFGHLKVPVTYVNKAGRPLGTQANTRRTQFHDLPPERAEELLSLGFIVNMLDHRWEEHFKAWLEYRDTHGTPVVPRLHVTKDGIPLGDWRIRRLQELRRGTLAADRRQKITDEGLHLSGNEFRYQRNVKALRAFREQHGHVRVPYNATGPDGAKFGEWVGRQQQALRDGKLTLEQAKILVAIGLTPAKPKGS